MSIVRSNLGLAAMALLALGPAASKAAEAPRFLSEPEVDQGIQLPPPPPDGSPRQTAELAEIHRIQDHSTAERRRSAQWDADHKTGVLFAPTFAPAFDLDRLPATARMLDDAYHDARVAIVKGKRFYMRKRPWVVEPSISMCTGDTGPLESYPSGHSTVAWTMGTVLADAWPAKARAIRARAAEFAESRLVCGSHFRSDIEAGKTLGQELGRDLLANPAFKAEEAAASKELAALP